MEKYNGNQKGFIYVSCDAKDHEEVFSKYLEPLAKDGVSFWWADAFDKKEEKTLARANAVLLFLTKDYVKEGKLRDTLTSAVRNNKPVLCVYLEDVELDAALSMQTEAQQALFVNKYENDEEFVKELKKAAVFERLEASEEQKGMQKKRTFAVVAIAAAAAILLFALILKPLLSGNKVNEETMTALGLQGMSKQELESIRTLRVIGNDIVEETSRRIEYTDDGRLIYTFDFDGGNVLNNGITTDRGSISDLTGIEQLTNLTTLQLTGQQIEDASQAYELEKLHTLVLSFNPLSSVDGIEKLSKLRTLDISHTDVEEIPDSIHIKEIKADGSALSKVPDFGGLSDVVFDAGGGTSITDVSNLSTASGYDQLDIDCSNVSASQVIEGLKGKRIKELFVSGLGINSLQELAGIEVTKNLSLGGSTITSLDGIENFEGLETLDLGDCHRLTDLSAVNRLDSLKYLRISEDMEDLASVVDDRIMVQITKPEIEQEEPDLDEEDVEGPDLDKEGEEE